MSRTLPKHRAREYETIFILHPDSGTDVVDKVAGRCQDVISRLEGKLLRAENWGRRRLAYSVKKQHKGVYIYLRYLGYQDLVHEIERNFRMLDPVIKYLTVKVDEDVNPEARPVREEEISFIPKFVEEDHGAREEIAAAPVEEAAQEVSETPAPDPSEAEDASVGDEAEGADEDADESEDSE